MSDCSGSTCLPFVDVIFTSMERADSIYSEAVSQNVIIFMIHKCCFMHVHLFLYAFIPWIKICMYWNVPSLMRCGVFEFEHMQHVCSLIFCVFARLLNEILVLPSGSLNLTEAKSFTTQNWDSKADSGSNRRIKAGSALSVGSPWRQIRPKGQADSQKSKNQLGSLKQTQTRHKAGTVVLWGTDVILQKTGAMGRTGQPLKTVKLALLLNFTG